MRRRAFVRLATAAGLALVTPDAAAPGFGLPGRRASADPSSLDAPPAVQAATWTPAIEPDQAGGSLSAPHRADVAFNALVVHWRHPDGWSGHDPAVEVRARRDGGDWGPWWRQSAVAERRGEQFGHLIDLPASANWVQVRVAPRDRSVVAADGIHGVAVTTIRSGVLDTPAPPTLSGSRPAATYPIWGAPFDDGVASPWPTPTFVPRPAWGATTPPPTAEGYWPPEFAPVQFITVHHTATLNLPPDPVAAIRAIHYFHSYLLDWGDIGYHFLIDPWGTIFQGRGGGPEAIAGHVYSYNRHNLGIALLGQFQPDAPDVPHAAIKPTGAQLASLTRLAAWACRKYDLDPLAVANYPLTDRRQGPFPRLIGHRDLHDGKNEIFPGQKPPATACPGDLLYALLPELRPEIADLAKRTQPSRLNPTLAAFGEYETYRPGRARGEFALGSDPSFAANVMFRLDVRSTAPHETPGANATGWFELIDADQGVRFVADRLGSLGVWVQPLTRGAYARGAGRTATGERAEFALSLTDDPNGQTARIWFTSGPGYHRQGALTRGRFTISLLD